MIKNIVAVIAGYLIFAISAVMFFKLTNTDPHTDPTTGYAIATAIYGVVFSALGGFITELIARTGNIKINLLLAVLMAGFAAFSLFKSASNHWTQLLAIVLFAPTSILGGWLYIKRLSR